jgi:uncharacterized protein YciI
MYLVLLYETVEDLVEKRKPYREAHLAMARKAHAEGSLLMAGALMPPNAALLLFRGEGPEVAEEFAKKDPYVVNGLVKSWRVLEWAVAVGGE